MNKKHFILSIILLTFCLGASFNPIGCNTTITGTVTDSATGNLISGAIVSIYLQYTFSLGAMNSATTNSDGIYTFTNIPYDSYTITASSIGYVDNSININTSYTENGISCKEIDGNIAISPEPTGMKIWEFLTDGPVLSSPAIGSDGTIYIGSSGGLYAINPDGTEKWKLAINISPNSSVAIGSDGTIYAGSFNCKLYAVNTDGTKKWEFLAGDYVKSSPIIDSDGTIYVGCDTSDLYAINPDGTEKWRFPAGNSIESSPAISSDGTIYFGCYDSKIYAINSDGTKKWEFSTGNLIDSSPAIASDGTMYIGSEDSKLYAMTGSGTLANSPWPMFHHDLRHTGQK